MQRHICEHVYMVSTDLVIYFPYIFFTVLFYSIKYNGKLLTKEFQYI